MIFINTTFTRIITYLKNHAALALLLTIFAIWRIIFMTRNHDIIWDEAVYIGIGKYIWSFGNAGLWEIIRPIGLPLLLGFPWKIGLDPIFWGEIIAILFSLACLFLTYLIGINLHSKLVGLLATILLGVTPTFFLYSGYILTDIPSSFIMLLAIWLFSSNRYAWAGFVASLAFLFRYPHGILLASLGLTLLMYYLATRTKETQAQTYFNSMVRFGSSYFILPSIFMIINWALYHTETSQAWHAIFRPWIFAAWHAGNPAEAAGGYTYYIQGILSENPTLWLLILGLIWFILAQQFKEPKHLAVWVSLSLYLVYFSSILNKQMRFALAFLPLITIMSAKGLIETIDWIAWTPSRKQFIRLAASIAIIGYVSLFLYPEDMKFFGWRFAQPQPIVHEIYEYFERSGYEGIILTSDPLLAAYTSRLYEPFYFSVDSSGKIYDQTIKQAAGVLFVPEVFYCGPDDSNCKKGLLVLKEKISKDNELVLEKTYGREDVGFRTYQIWKKKIHNLSIG